MTEGRPRGRAPQHHLVMALRQLADLPGAPRYTAFDRPRQLYLLTADDGTERALAPTDVPVYLSGCADAAAAVARPAARAAGPAELLAAAFSSLHTATSERTLPPGARLAPYLEGVQDAARALVARPPGRRRTEATAYGEIALQALRSS